MSVTTSHKQITMLREKVLVIGDATVGKTALCQMFYSGGYTYPRNYVMTTAMDLSVKAVKIPDSSTQVELYLHDNPGQTVFNQLGFGHKLWEDASSVILVFDISNRDSFTSCAKWLRMVQESRPGQAIEGVIIANKVDLRDSGRAVVSKEEAQDFARSVGLEYFETSAETGLDVDAPFNHVADAFHRKYEETMRGIETDAF